MNYHPAHVEETGALKSGREHVAELIGRYPQVSDEESREILTFLRTGKHLDVGLLTSDDRLRPSLDAFMEDHKSHFRVKWAEGAAVIGGMIALLIILWLVWGAFA